MKQQFLLPIFWLSLMFCFPIAACAENDGIDDLDKASERMLQGASSFKEISEIIDLLDGAISKGLDDDNRELAQKQLTGMLNQRAQLLTDAIFGRGKVNPNWRQFRQVALGDLKRATEIDENFAEAHLKIGRLNALPGGDRDQAIQAFTKVTEIKDVSNKLSSKALAMRSALQPSEEQQLADLSQAIKIDPTNLDALRARGVYSLQKDNFKTAIEDLEKAVAIDPKHGATLEAYGMALLWGDRYDDAVKAFSKAIKELPTSPTPYTNRARAYAMLNKNKQALEDLDKSIGLDPSNLAVLLLRAQIYQQEGKPDKAHEDIEQALKVRPDWLPAQRMRAELLAAEEKIDEAITEIKRLIELHPTNAELLMQLGSFYALNDQNQEAITTLNKVIDADQENWSALRRRGDIKLNMAQQASAIEDYEAVLKKEPKDPGTLNNLAWVLCTSPDGKIRDGKRAIQLALQACEETDYKQGHILSTLAAAYAETGDFENARKWAKKAVEIGGEEHIDQLKQELASYQQEKPWRELQNVEDKKKDKQKKPDDKPPVTTPDF